MFQMNIMNNYNSLHGLPAFVKESAVVSRESLEGLPHTAFADPLRKLPVHSKVATWCSFLSYHAGAVKDATGTAPIKLEKAAAFWGIGGECREVLANLEKDATPRQPVDNDFALVANHAGEKYRRFPVAGPENIQKSAEELIATRQHYPLPWRKEAAQKIIKRAADLSVQLVNDHQLQQMAGIGISKASEIIPHLRLRAKLVKDAKIREKFEALAVEIEKVGELTPDVLAKMANALDIADRASGIYQYYGRGIEAPEIVCHQHTLKEVTEKRAGIIALTNGQGVMKEALAKMSADRFTALGDEFVSAISGSDGNVDISKAEAIVPTLPADDANLFINSL